MSSDSIVMAVAADAANHPTLGDMLFKYGILIFWIQIAILIAWGRWLYVRQLNPSSLRMAERLGICGRIIVAALLLALAVRRFSLGGFEAAWGIIPLLLAEAIRRDSRVALNWIRWLVAGLAVVVFLGVVNNPFCIMDLDAAGDSVGGVMLLGLLITLALGFWNIVSGAH